MQQAQLLAVDQTWDLPPPSSAADDALLGCLLVLARFLNNPVSADSLTAGLPLVDHRLTPELFIRAATRGARSRPIDEPANSTTAGFVCSAAATTARVYPVGS